MNPALNTTRPVLSKQRRLLSRYRVDENCFINQLPTLVADGKFIRAAESADYPRQIRYCYGGLDIRVAGL